MIYIVFIVLLNFFTISCIKNKVYNEKFVTDDDINLTRSKSYPQVSEKNEYKNLEKNSNNEKSTFNNIPVTDTSNITNSKNGAHFSNTGKKFGNLNKIKLDKTQLTVEKRPSTLSSSQIKVYNEKDPTPDKLKLNRTQKSEKANKGNNKGAEEDTLNNVDTLDDDDPGISKSDKEKAKVSISTDVITVFPELYK